MHEWSESQLMIREAVRGFVENEIAPHVEELEHGDMPPYALLRKMFQTFGMDEMARASFAKKIEAEKKGEERKKRDKRETRETERRDAGRHREGRAPLQVQCGFQHEE